MTTRINKRITVLHHIDESGTHTDPDSRFTGKTFRSYQAVVKMLKPTEKVLVSVEEGDKNLWIHSGYGEVERINDVKFSEPRNLMHDY